MPHAIDYWAFSPNLQLCNGHAKERCMQGIAGDPESSSGRNNVLLIDHGLDLGKLIIHNS